MRLNVVRGVGPLYWIVRDTGTKAMPMIALGWVHELGGYWRKGKGIQIRISKYVFQFGFCQKSKIVYNEDEGLLYAMEGRMMAVETKEIREWK